MNEIYRIGPCSDIPLCEGRKYVLQGEEIGIFNLGEEVLAISNRCPHKGGPLSDGIVTGKEVICPLHSRKVNLKNGCVANENEKVKTYKVVVENGDIHLEK